METIEIIIERSADYYDAYAENCEGIYGAGETPEAAKQDALKGLELFVKSRDKKDLPKILQGQYTITFRYDTQSFLKHYNAIFTNAALERMTGINQTLLYQYSRGIKKPREAQRKKIQHALHGLAKELLSVEL
jgi:predicted RNase H-like HicB family nuclease